MTYQCQRCAVRWAADSATAEARDCWICGRRDLTKDSFQLVQIAQRNSHDWADLVAELRESAC